MNGDCLQYQKWLENLRGSSVKTVKKVRWDPIIAKLADYGVKQHTFKAAIETAESSQISSTWIDVTQKRSSKEEFEAFLHDLFDRNGPVVKYQNPDIWNAYPTKN